MRSAKSSAKPAKKSRRASEPKTPQGVLDGFLTEYAASLFRTKRMRVYFRLDHWRLARHDANRGIDEVLGFCGTANSSIGYLKSRIRKMHDFYKPDIE
jgi:hypothetical protein